MSETSEKISEMSGMLEKISEKNLGDVGDVGENLGVIGENLGDVITSRNSIRDVQCFHRIFQKT